MKRKKIEIMDTTLRDGEQTSGMSFSEYEKLTISKLLLKELKVDRIISEKCDVFIDDLPEIFEIPSFPDFVNKYLFDPNETYVGNRFLSFSSWLEIKNEFEKCVIKKK